MLQVRRDHDHVEVPRLSVRIGAAQLVLAETQQEVRFLADVYQATEELRVLRAACKRIDFSVGYPLPRLSEDMASACAVAVRRRYHGS